MKKLACHETHLPNPPNPQEVWETVVRERRRELGCPSRSCQNFGGITYQSIQQMKAAAGPLGAIWVPHLPPSAPGVSNRRMAADRAVAPRPQPRPPARLPGTA